MNDIERVTLMVETDRMGALVVGQLQKLQDWLREPDHAEHFDQSDLMEWLNRRPSHIIPSVIHHLAVGKAAVA